MNRKNPAANAVIRIWRRLERDLNPKKAIFTDQLMAENERHANWLVSAVLFGSVAIMLLSVLLNEIGVYRVSKTALRLLAVWSVVMLVPAILNICFKGRKKWLKIVMLTVMTLYYANVNAVLTFHVELLMVIPVVLSSRYYSRQLTIWVALITSVLFFAASMGAGYHSVADLNFTDIPAGTVITVNGSLREAIESLNIDVSPGKGKIFIYYFLPKYLLFLLAAYASVRIAGAGRFLVAKQDKISREFSRVETELDVATGIQTRALPEVDELPHHPSFDIAARMYPAREVGGDFYDFVYIDPTHLALFIADVSGKGVPAALLMMVSKMLLDTGLSANNGSPAKILADVNHRLCEKNIDDMFVTCWLGILDLETGSMQTANAGHEYPMLCHAGGKFEIIKDKHGLVLGGLDGSRYSEMTLQLQPGDTLFVYTDGVPEAVNTQKEQYGLERAIGALNRVGTEDMNAMIEAVKKDIDTFCGDEPQFDDTTMLAFHLDSIDKLDGITVKPDKDSMTQVVEYVENLLDEHGVDMARIYKMNIAVDELYSNIIRYSNAEWAQIVCRVDDGGNITLIMRDNGIPYDPRMAKEPDVTLSAEERKIGGLGIFMTKKLMTSLDYISIKGCNETVVTLAAD